MSYIFKIIAVVGLGVVAPFSWAEAADAGPAVNSGRSERHFKGDGNSLQRMKRLDADHDGAVSKAEFTGPRGADFKELDTNHDGFVDPAEINASMAEQSEFRTKRFLKRVDANRDGKVTLEEFEQGPRGHFTARDINNDGKLNAQDRPPATGGGWFSGGGDRKMGLGASRANRPDVTLDTVVNKAAASFADLDTNKDGVLDGAEIAKQATEKVEFARKRLMHWADANNDGKLSEDEFSARALKRFANLDLNDDGKIDAQDFPASGSKGLFSR